MTVLEWLQLAGVLLAAVASSVGAFLAVLRYRADNQHVKARLWFRSLRVQEGVRGQIGGELFNRGRRTQVLIYTVSVLGDGTALNVDVRRDGIEAPTLPRWLEPGEAFVFRQDAAVFSARLQAIIAENFPGREPAAVLMRKMRVHFMDGEGHNHFGSLDRDSRPQLALWLEWLRSRDALLATQDKPGGSSSG